VKWVSADRSIVLGPLAVTLIARSSTLPELGSTSWVTWLRSMKPPFSAVMWISLLKCVPLVMEVSAGSSRRLPGPDATNERCWSLPVEAKS
jgi:hypothetical protein